jgi:RHS repeat-associated protein
MLLLKKGERKDGDQSMGSCESEVGPRGSGTGSQAWALGLGKAAAVAAVLAAVSLVAVVVGATGVLSSAGSPPFLRASAQGHLRPGAGSHRGLLSLPASARGPISADLGAVERGYEIRRIGTGLGAPDRTQGFSERFGRSGAQVRSGVARLGMGLQGIGYAGSGSSGAALAAVTEAAPRAQANRVLYAHPGVSESYANGPAGLEQSFAIAHAPAQAGGRVAGPLALSLALSGDTHPALGSGGQSVTFTATGGFSLRYDDLSVSDARGRALHSWMSLHGNRLLIEVDAAGARYPLRVDPLIQQGSKLTVTEETGEGQVGYAVALSSDGSTALVGAPNNKTNVGAVWIFTHSGGTWSQQAKLTGSEESGEGHFGDSVSLSSNGNLVVIGGEGDSSSTGAAWIFTRSGSTWTQQAKLTGKEETGAGHFGSSVAVSANASTVLVGGEADNTNVGAAWVFTETEVTTEKKVGCTTTITKTKAWTQQGAKLTGSEEKGEGDFGDSVALSSEGSTALIGGRGDNTKTGAAWVFTRSGSTWSQQVKLTASEETGAGALGASVALSSEGGNTALLGAPNNATKVGAAWVFTRSEGKWTQQAKLTGASETGEGHFANSVALSSTGSVALAGAPNNATNVGAAWEFERAESKWSQLGPKVTGTEETGAGTFGNAVALSGSGEAAMVGGPGDNTNKGAAWAFSYGMYSEEEYGCANSGEPNIQPPCSGPVDTATGNLVLSQTDLAVGGRGPGLHVVRTYNSQLASSQTEPGPFGFGWTGSYSAYLTIGTELVTVHQDNGSTVTFWISGAEYVPVGGWIQATLVKSGTEYIYTLPDQTELEFNGKGQLLKETDRNGNAITLTYNGSKQLESVADAAGRKLTFTYKEGFVEKIEDPMKNIVKYTYESKNLVKVVEPGEKEKWEFKYNASHELETQVDGRSNATTIEYESHKVSLYKDPLERKTSYKYTETEAGSETTISEANTSKTVEVFNSAGLLTSITLASGEKYAATTTYEYDGSYDTVAVTDPDRHTTKYTYSTAGDLTSVTDPNENMTKQTYDKTHDLETEITPQGETTTIKRNANGDPEVIERPAPGKTVQKTKIKYAANGDVESETNPLGQETTFTYGKYGDPTSEIDPEKNKRTWEYNEDSQATSEVSPRGNVKEGEASKYTTKITYDPRGRPLEVTDPLGHVTKYVYDADGNLEKMTDGNEHTTKKIYDADSEQIEVEAPNGIKTKTGYDNAGQVTSQTNGNSDTTEYRRNLLEEVTETIDPLSRKTKDEYDAAGNLKTFTDPKGRTTTYTYDTGNRLKEVSYSETSTHAVAYEYNKDGDVTKMTDGTGETTYSYDELDRLTETVNGNKEKVAYEYNLGNEQTKITYPNEKSVTRSYDADDLLEKITDWKSNETKFSYDPDGNLKAITFPSGTSNEDTYAYDEDDQMSEIAMKKGIETLASLSYARDKDGQLKTVTSKGLPGEATIEYGYDENNRTTKAGPTAYEYDKANDPTKIGANTYTYDKDGELETGGGSTYTFDELGERTKTKPSTGPATTYGYNQAEDLISVERSEEGKTPKIEDTYAYEGNGLRTSQTISKVATHMAWDLAGEELPLLLYDGTNDYIYGPSGPIEQINNTTGEVLYLHSDQQGSTRMLTGTTGAKEGAASYDAYGKPTTEGKTTPLGYDGQYTSSDTGLDYMRARELDPGETDQYLTGDPAEAETEAPYNYAGDNPINAEDTSGLNVSAGPCLDASAGVNASRALQLFGGLQVCVMSEWLTNARLLWPRDTKLVVSAFYNGDIPLLHTLAEIRQNIWELMTVVQDGRQVLATLLHARPSAWASIGISERWARASLSQLEGTGTFTGTLTGINLPILHVNPRFTNMRINMGPAGSRSMGVQFGRSTSLMPIDRQNLRGTVRTWVYPVPLIG